MIYNIPRVSQPGRALNDYSWAEIRAISDADQGEKYFSLGDCKEITLNGMVGTMELTDFKCCVFIMGFNHNADREGKGITFGCFKSALKNGVAICLYGGGTFSTDGSKGFNMNHSEDRNSGGWKGCDLRYDILGSTDVDGEDASLTTATNPVPNTLMAALPADLRAVMRPMTIYTDNSGGIGVGSGKVSATVDYLPLMAEYEARNSSSYYANDYERTYQDSYSGVNIIRRSHANPNTQVKWWLRSPRENNRDSFCAIEASGVNSHEQAMYKLGIAPIFRV